VKIVISVSCSLVTFTHRPHRVTFEGLSIIHQVLFLLQMIFFSTEDDRLGFQMRGVYSQ
jgi:hypothetical protein